MEDISVVIPLGPNPCYLEWLPECLASVLNQTYLPSEIVIIDDGANLSIEYLCNLLRTLVYFHAIESFTDYFTLVLQGSNKTILVKLYKTLWNVGVPDAFNFGISLASNELVFMLGSDDKLMPTCLEECVKTWEANNKKDAWYSVTIEYQNGQLQWLPCNASMTSKTLWKWLGGFPPSAGVGGCDAILLSILMRHAPDRIVYVKQGTPLCWLREHEHQDTKHNAWQFPNEIVSIRNIETARWKPREVTIK